MNCVFCEGIEDSHVLLETDNYKVVFDIDPIQIGHLLIISKTHYETLIEISEELLVELMVLQKQMITLLEKEFHVDGVSIIQNNGNIMDEGTHFHVHLVPRYFEDQFWTNQQVVEQPLSMKKLEKQIKLLVQSI